jgi:hypothetical protein
MIDCTVSSRSLFVVHFERSLVRDLKTSAPDGGSKTPLFLWGGPARRVTLEGTIGGVIWNPPRGLDRVEVDRAQVNAFRRYHESIDDWAIDVSKARVRSVPSFRFGPPAGGAPPGAQFIVPLGPTEAPTPTKRSELTSVHDRERRSLVNKARRTLSVPAGAIATGLLLAATLPGGGSSRAEAAPLLPRAPISLTTHFHRRAIEVTTRRATIASSHQRHASPPLEPSNYHPNPPPVPGAAGRLTARYRVRMVSQQPTARVSERYASGMITLRLYGHTEICWKISHTRGLYLPQRIEVWMLSPYLFLPGHPLRPEPYEPFGGPYARNACETGLIARTNRLVERDPRQYLIGIADARFSPAIGGRL